MITSSRFIEQCSSVHFLKQKEKKQWSRMLSKNPGTPVDLKI